MAKIVFFSILAYGHTNPTIEVVRELTKRGNDVHYYSFNIFRERLEEVGATFISCDEFMPKLTSNIEKRVGKDFSALIQMVTDVTIAMNDKVIKELEEFKPDVIVSDSVCFWGKLYAKRLGIKYICSTTTLCYNNKTAKLIKRDIREILYMIFGIKKINDCMTRLKDAGYDVTNFIDIIANSNDTNTITYTSKKFQPYSETFSNLYHFVGPSIKEMPKDESIRDRKKIYISFGTVVNKDDNFYEKCIGVLSKMDVDVIISVGESINIDEIVKSAKEKYKLESISNIKIYPKVDQIEILSSCDLFISHSGNNSVQESLYYGVPLILYPKHSEERSIAIRVKELGAGVIAKNESMEELRKNIVLLFSDDCFKKKAKEISKAQIESGGFRKAASVIENIALKDMKVEE